MTCLYTNANIDYSKDPAGATVDVQTIRVMNRYWTEAVNINIGNDQDFKISNILVESAVGTVCSYPLT